MGAFTSSSADDRKEKAKNKLMEAIRNGDLEAVKLCVEEVSDINFLMKDVAGNERTPLILASVEGKTEIVGYFADSGAELDKVNEMGWTAISHAASKGHVGLIEYLLAKGADKDKANNDGVSPLYIAAQNGHLMVLQCLLKHGADKDKTTNKGATPLYVAVQGQHLDVIQCLVEDAEADVNKATTDASFRITPLHIAVLHDRADIAICLMEHGMADLNARNIFDWRPIDHARNEAMRQVIINEDLRRRDLGARKRIASKSVEQASSKRTRR